MILLQSAVPTGQTVTAAEPPPATEPKLAPVLPTGQDPYFPTVALSQDGKRLLTGDSKTAILWDVAAGKQLQIFKGHSGSIRDVALSADGKQVVTGSLDQTAILWEAATGKKLQTFEHAWPVLSVALSADGKHLVTGSNDQPTILWEAVTGKKLQTIGQRNFRSALSANGKRVLTVGGDTATLWETATGKALQTFHGHEVGIWCVALSADGKKAFVEDTDPASNSYYMIVWDATSGKQLRTFQVLPPQAGRRHQATDVTCVALSAEGDQLVTGCADGTTDLWETATGKKLHTLQGHTRFVTSAALAADGRHAWTAGYDANRLWDTKSGKELCALLIFDGGKEWLVVTPEGFFDGCEGAWKRLFFRATGTSKLVDDDATRRKFSRPGLLGTLYRGEKPKP
jgi:WD40 repeat protein